VSRSEPATPHGHETALPAAGGSQRHTWHLPRPHRRRETPRRRVLENLEPLCVPRGGDASPCPLHGGCLSHAGLDHSSMRELIAAHTSAHNACACCARSHAAAASVWFVNDAVVEQILGDLEQAPIGEKDKGLLRFVGRVTTAVPSIGEADVATVRAAGWDDEASLLRDHRVRPLQLLQPLDLCDWRGRDVGRGASAAGPSPCRKRLHPRLGPSSPVLVHVPEWRARLDQC